VIRDIIEEKLTAAYAPDALEIIDESHLHAGHNEAAASGETHFRVRMVAQRFDGVSRLDRQRQVLALLADELAGPVHALALKLKSPDEAARDG
jgi:BolA protein